MPFRAFLAALMLLIATPVLAGPASGLLIAIDKGAQRMTVSIDGALRFTWPVSTGLPGRETPAGSFQPFRMEEQHFSKEWDDAPMPHSVFFTQTGHAIHGSTATARLGTPASHGCVRLSPENATKLFGLVEAEGLLNTRVVITGTEPGSNQEPRVADSGRADGMSPDVEPNGGPEAGVAKATPKTEEDSGAEPNVRAEPAPRRAGKGAAPDYPQRERSWIDEDTDRSVFADSFYDGRRLDQYGRHHRDRRYEGNRASRWPWYPNDDEPTFQVFPEDDGSDGNWN